MMSGYSLSAASMTCVPSCPGSRRSVMTTSNAKSARSLDRALRRLGLDDVEPAIRQLLGDRLAQRRFVFDQQQMFRCVSHLAGVGILTLMAEAVKRMPNRRAARIPIAVPRDSTDTPNVWRA